jgi:hypothetical protein
LFLNSVREFENHDEIGKESEEDHIACEKDGRELKVQNSEFRKETTAHRSQFPTILRRLRIDNEHRPVSDLIRESASGRRGPENSHRSKVATASTASFCAFLRM